MSKEQNERISGYRDILKKTIEQEAINSDEELKKSSFSVARAKNSPSFLITTKSRLLTIFNENRRQRLYILRQLFKYIFAEDSYPKKAIEVGSAGDISLALALPNCEVSSVDIDLDIFLNYPYNSLPDAFLKKIGQKKSLEGYGGSNWIKRKKKKLELVQSMIPNWIPRVEDANDLSDDDNTFEFAIVQGTPDMLDFINELARVIQPGGYIVSIVDEEYREENSESAYTQKRYNTLPEYEFISDQKLQELRLERIDVPETFKTYEELCIFSFSKGTSASTGYVFEIFRKLDNESK